MRSSLVAVCCSSATRSSLLRASSLLEEADVLDGDDGLVSEDLHETNLLVEERLGLASIHGDRADDLAFTDHRNGQGGPHARGPRGLCQLELWIGLNVRDVHESTRLDRPRRDHAPAGPTRIRGPERIRPVRSGFAVGDEVDELAVEREHRALPRVAQSLRARRDRLEDGLDVRR